MFPFPPLCLPPSLSQLPAFKSILSLLPIFSSFLPLPLFHLSLSLNELPSDYWGLWRSITNMCAGLEAVAGKSSVQWLCLHFSQRAWARWKRKTLIQFKGRDLLACCRILFSTEWINRKKLLTPNHSLYKIQEPVGKVGSLIPSSPLKLNLYSFTLQCCAQKAGDRRLLRFCRSAVFRTWHCHTHKLSIMHSCNHAPLLLLFLLLSPPLLFPFSLSFSCPLSLSAVCLLLWACFCLHIIASTTWHLGILECSRIIHKSGMPVNNGYFKRAT